LALEVYCIGCNKEPKNIKEYKDIMKLTGSLPDFIVRQEETFNSLNGHFVCPRCYFKCGVPNPVDGWKAP
jgi:hypothetical protein